jgi:hypothetical protein
MMNNHSGFRTSVRHHGRDESKDEHKSKTERGHIRIEEGQGRCQSRGDKGLPGNDRGLSRKDESQSRKDSGQDRGLPRKEGSQPGKFGGQSRKDRGCIGAL